MKKYLILGLSLLLTFPLHAQQADKNSYLDDIKAEMQKVWPKNRTVNVVFHGHSVPSGYAVTPVVNTLNAYPHMLLVALKTEYKNAVINVITTSIGGEQSEQGETRFKDEVLTHRPDVIFIDYGLNDRGIGLERSEKAWRKMIESTLNAGVKLVLLTPTPDLNEDILDDKSPLNKHSDMIRSLAKEYKIGLIDSYKIFKEKAQEGENLKKYMSQNNHPNSAGHSVVSTQLITWFM
ncbi:MAG: GDSL-type esterase/lipase family protein [Rikenellaceae bacterium]